MPEPPAKVAPTLRTATTFSARAIATDTGSARIRIGFTVPQGSSRVAVNLWERFGRHIAQIVDEHEPAAGDRSAEWDAGNGGIFIVRITVDDDSDSEIIHVPPPASGDVAPAPVIYGFSTTGPRSPKH